MKIKLSFVVVLMFSTYSFSQSKSFWKKESMKSASKIKAGKQDVTNPDTYTLDLQSLKNVLKDAPRRGESRKPSNLIISFPSSKGILENFRITEAPVMHPDLQAKYPDIRSYAGQGIDDPSEIIRFSVSPLGLNSMTLSAHQKSTFIEPYTEDLAYYRVYNRSDRTVIKDDFECEVTKQVNNALNKSSSLFQKNADDGVLRTYRLAVSTTGEYTNYHGGTVALALAAINTTMTRVNGVFETDFNVTMQLIADTDSVIYTNSASDPYGNTSSGFNGQLQSTLTSVIGEANYDVGHLFATAGNSGSAGCIGCVCVNNQKGRGWTSRGIPEGDSFDIDYVAHELGHQFGAYHTWTHGGDEETNGQMEPGSGSTIMGYAGITGATNVQSNSDPYFHAINIEQVTDYVKSTSCQTNTNTGNAVPVVNAGPNYTIPSGTAFVLEGSATDANSGNVLTYCWEQMDENNASTTYPSTTATTGVAFRSYNPTTDTKRYFPRLETVKTGATSWLWEAVPNVARSLNFRLTVRDNVAGGGANSSDDVVVTVNDTAGPFIVNFPNTNVTWNAGTTQTVTWDVAGTTGNGINAANVDILLSTDGGDTYTTTLATSVANDGSHDIVIPNIQGTQNRIMIKGTNNIFFDISNANFTITAAVACNATVPTGINSSNVSATESTISWDAITGATYDVRYRVVGTSTWTTNAVTGTSVTLSGLSVLTDYEVQVRSNCTSGSSAYSSSFNFSTPEVQLNYCSSNGNNVSDEYIGSVQIGSIDNATAASSGGYGDYTSITTDLAKGASATITVTPIWTGTLYNEGYAVFIDYNKDGDFEDSGETVWTQSATQATSVSGSFTVPTTAITGLTRMRVVMQYNTIPSSCGSYNYGETEDYNVNLVAATLDTEAPTVPTNLNASNITETSATLNWNASTDNVAVTSYNVYQGSTLFQTVTGTTTNITGLSATTQYTFSVTALDEANNESGADTVTFTTIGGSTTCASTVSSFPYSESFESGDGWTQASGDDGDWVNDASGTPSSDTGPSSGSEGSFYMFLEASGTTSSQIGAIGTFATAILESPCFDLSAESGATFTFQNHMYGTGVGSLELEASTDGGASWVSLWILSGNQGNQWNAVSVDLNSYLGQTISLRFVGTTGPSWSSDIAIDNLELITDEVTTGCDTLNFNDYAISSFSSQDIFGTFSVENDGISLALTNNTWKYIDFAYEVTANTVIELEFSSTLEGEIHGVGFENDNSLTSTFYFKFYGTQNYGVTNYDNYSSGTTTYVIPVGDSYAGSMDRLVFINDNDGGSGNTSTFSNVKVYETSCTSSRSSVVFGERIDVIGNENEISFTIYPNPVKSSVLHINTFGGFEDASYQVTNMLGQTVLKGNRVVAHQINVDALESGIYMLELNDGKQVASKRFIKQ